MCVCVCVFSGMGSYNGINWRVCVFFSGMGSCNDIEWRVPGFFKDGKHGKANGDSEWSSYWAIFVLSYHMASHHVTSYEI